MAQTHIACIIAWQDSAEFYWFDAAGLLGGFVKNEVWGDRRICRYIFISKFVCDVAGGRQHMGRHGCNHGLE